MWKVKIWYEDDASSDAMDVKSGIRFVSWVIPSFTSYIKLHSRHYHSITLSKKYYMTQNIQEKYKTDLQNI